ncbi:MAG: XdhC family protein [Ferroplasma sp.]|uniref:XdhC family protein n=1 Tax=Ferroplasma sp. TaxID=2591003 RepID=UPI0028155C43|nr:XdhC family protein [Ferroplasma sp.]WMT50460.1 MAG: XdhC family protein [Ferroplasma sp.]
MYDDILSLQADLQKSKSDYAVATVIRTSGSSIAKPGFKILAVHGQVLKGTLGSPSLDNIVLKEAEGTIEKNETKYLRIALDKDNKTSDYAMNTTCGGMIELFIEPYVHRRSLVILVESFNDKLLEALKTLIPYTGLMPEVYNINDKNDSKHLMEYDFRDDFVLLITKTENEIPYIAHFLMEKPRYLAMVSSRNRFNRDMESVLKDHPDADRNGIKCPAGLSINAITVNEIAVSIIAEIIMEKNNKNLK